MTDKELQESKEIFGKSIQELKGKLKDLEQRKSNGDITFQNYKKKKKEINLLMKKYQTNLKKIDAHFKGFSPDLSGVEKNYREALRERKNSDAGEKKPKKIKRLKRSKEKKKVNKVFLAAGVALIGATAAVGIAHLMPEIIQYTNLSNTVKVAHTMMENSTIWHSAVPTDQTILHTANVKLADTLSDLTGKVSKYVGHTGEWFFGDQKMGDFVANLDAQKSLLAKGIAAKSSAALAALATGSIFTFKAFKGENRKKKKEIYNNFLKEIEEAETLEELEDLEKKLKKTVELQAKQTGLYKKIDNKKKELANKVSRKEEIIDAISKEYQEKSLTDKKLSDWIFVISSDEKLTADEKKELYAIVTSYREKLQNKDRNVTLQEMQNKLIYELNNGLTKDEYLVLRKEKFARKLPEDWMNSLDAIANEHFAKVASQGQAMVAAEFQVPFEKVHESLYDKPPVAEETSFVNPVVGAEAEPLEAVKAEPEYSKDFYLFSNQLKELRENNPTLGKYNSLKSSLYQSIRLSMEEKNTLNKLIDGCIQELQNMEEAKGKGR